MNYPRANYPRKPDAVDIALAAIMAALYPNGLAGWEDWSRYALTGEWF
jgi:hypothetical protein